MTMSKYKVHITKENFDAFAECYADRECTEAAYLQARDEFIYIKENFLGKNEVFDNIQKMFSCDFMADEENRYTFNPNSSYGKRLKTVADYCSNAGIAWNVVMQTEHWLYLEFSGNYMVWDKKFCTIQKLPDYEEFTMTQLRAQIDGLPVSGELPVEMNALSICSAKEEKNILEKKQEELKRRKEDINFARVPELKELEDEINKKKLELHNKKQELLSEIEKKKTELEEQLDKVYTQIHMMESEIYMIRSYNGETLELHKVREGQPATADTPLVVNQKLLYLDEDLARIVSIYQDEISRQYETFADAVAGSFEVFDSFCPQERSLSFFCLSKNGTYCWYNSNRNMYETEELLHGKKIGFLLRDGERAYVGWLDEVWRINKDGNKENVWFGENLMYQPGTNEFQQNSDSDIGANSDSRNSMLSRIFAMSVVQGILDHEGLLAFPEKVNITKPGKYLTYNFAAGWIMDDRFGDFGTLVDNLNKRTREGDQILVCVSRHGYGLTGRGENNRTHDCELKEGLNRVNYVESDQYGRSEIYVSAKKRWSDAGATANVKVNYIDYINLAYMNSIWMRYYVQTKKMGRFKSDYARMIKHFKRAIEVLEERETAEMILIKKYYPAADEIPEWQIELSHWKLNHKMRVITDFQAKRVAKYFAEGKFVHNAHIFDEEVFYDDIKSDANGLYVHTEFTNYYGFGEKAEYEFGRHSEYDQQRFFVKGLRNPNSMTGKLSEKDAAENDNILAVQIPVLEALLPERLKKEEKKLSLVNDYAGAFIRQMCVNLKQMSAPFGIVYDNGAIDFRRVDDLVKEDRDAFFAEVEGNYPEYILKSDCWKLAYYAFVQEQYDKVFKNARMLLHDRFMTETEK